MKNPDTTDSSYFLLLENVYLIISFIHNFRIDKEKKNKKGDKKMKEKELEFCSFVEGEILQLSQELDSRCSFIHRDFLEGEISDSSAEMEEDAAEAEYQSELGRLCSICFARGVADENLRRLFGEDYERYL